MITNSKLIFFFLYGLVFFLISCKKNEPEAKIETGKFSELTHTTIKVDGNILDLGNGIFDYGHVWSEVPYLTVIDTSICKTTNFGKANKTGVYQSELTRLEPGKWYYVKAYGITKRDNVASYVFGIEYQFLTPIIELPSLTTSNITSITSTSAFAGGNIISDGGTPVKVRGLCWGTSPHPTINSDMIEVGTGIGNFTYRIFGLTPNTKYNIRAYATNNVGIQYGDEVYFSSNDTVLFNPDLSYGEVADLEGNNYKTVQIGTQTWMAENLRSTKLNDGSSIGPLFSNDQWMSSKNPGYCWYNNDAIYKATYGALYNQYLINDSSKLCPLGWHIPTVFEAYDLIMYLGGEEVGGTKMKETGIAHWNVPYIDATNECGFTALPGGQRIYSGGFIDIKNSANWWIINNNTYPSSFFVSHTYGNVHVIESMGNGFGLSIRCIRDN